jgi:Zn-dependent protease with chaperone function
MAEQLKSILRYCALLLIIFFVATWMTNILYLSSIGQKQQPLTKVTDSPLLAIIKSKTGLKLDSFQIAASDKLYGNMVGIPGHPYMMLSSKLNDIFTDSEKEYVVLHETGHYLLNHTIKETILGLFLFLIGCFIIHKHRKLYLVPIIGITFGLLCIQYGMVSEKEADRFALAHITDPNGMITATDKFRSAHYPPLDDYSPLWPILFRSNPYHVRIEMAKREIVNRENKLAPPRGHLPN